MLYSTRESIAAKYLNFLTKVPEGQNKNQCEIDICRTEINIGEEKDVTRRKGAHVEYNESNPLFERTQENIAEIAKEQFSTIDEEELKYFSFLMTHLCFQGFSNHIIMGYFITKNPAQSFNGSAREMSLNIVDGKPVLSYDMNIKSIRPHDTTPRKFSVKFFHDVTMQVSMENHNDTYKLFFEDMFKYITSQSEEAKHKHFHDNNQPELYKENDLFSLLAMSCDQEKCRIVTQIINTSHAPHQFTSHTLYRLYNNDIQNDDIQKISSEIAKLYAIEKLSKANPYTVARLVHNYMKDNAGNNLSLSNDLYKNLSEEAKANINRIADEIQYRINKIGTVKLAVWDIINIIVDCFLSILKFFELKLGESGVFSKEFDQFCRNLSTEEILEEDQQLYFTKNYLDLKKATNSQSTLLR